MSLCLALTKKGTQCQREVSHKPADNSKYCYQHQSSAKQDVKIKKKIPLKDNHYKSIFTKIFSSKLDQRCFDLVKDNLWKAIDDHFDSSLSKSQYTKFKEQVLTKFELYVKTSRQEYLNHIKELETTNPTLVEENVYMDEYIASVWEVNIEENGFDDWLMGQIGQWIQDWSLPYYDEDGDWSIAPDGGDEDGNLPNEPLREEIRNYYIEGITTALKTCYH